jgi:hypothetical protein
LPIGRLGAAPGRLAPALTPEDLDAITNNSRPNLNEAVFIHRGESWQ